MDSEKINSDSLKPSSYIDYDNDPYFNEPTIKHKSLAKRLEHWSLAVLFAAGVINAGIVTYNYHNSLDWSTNRDSLKMADVPVDMLNDSPSQTKAKGNFLVLYQKALASNGALTANKAQLIQLKQALSKIKTAKPVYQKKYNKVAVRYHIQAELDSLFQDKTTLKKSATPTKVRAVLRDIGPDLNDIYQANNHDAFVKQELPRVHKLVHDSNQIATYSNKLATVAKLKHGTFYPVASLTPGTYQKIYHKLTKLNYKWTCFDNFAKMQEEINNDLNDQLAKINHYNDYLKDLRDKEQAYEDLAKKREAHKEANAQAIEEKRKEKLEKQRAQQEAKESSESNSDNAKRSDDTKSSDSDSSKSNTTTKHSDSSSNNSSSSTGSTSSNSNSNSGNTNSNTQTAPSRPARSNSNTNSNSNSTTHSNSNANNNSGNSNSNSSPNGGKSNGIYVNPSDRNSESDPANILRGD